MSKQKILLIIPIFILAGIILALPNSNAKSKKQFTPQPLIGATEEEINEAAIEYTYYRFKVLSGEPSVVLTMPVIKDELPSLGLSSIGFSGEEPPMTLVLLMGDFDISNIRGWHQNSPLKVSFLVYVFDLNAGVPTLIEYSVNGDYFDELFRKVDLTPIPKSQ